MKNGNAGDKVKGDSSHDAFISKPPDKKKVKCFYCKKKGHIAKDCSRRKLTVINNRKLKKSPQKYLQVDIMSAVKVVMKRLNFIQKLLWHQIMYIRIIIQIAIGGLTLGHSNICHL